MYVAFTVVADFELPAYEKLDSSEYNILVYIDYIAVN